MKKKLSALFMVFAMILSLFSGLGVNTVDIGLPQLAMHSPYETAGVEDTGSFIRAAEEFFI